MRSALDHLAYGLVVVGLGGAPANPSVVCYPIVDSAAAYPAFSNRRLRGVQQAAKAAIDATKPYPGGNDTLWQLHKLNNVDKHRLLLTVRSRARGVDLGGYAFRKMRESSPKIAAAFAPDAIAAFFKESDAPFPLTYGYEFFREPTEFKPDEHLRFTFDIALGEPGIIEGEPVVGTLQNMLRVVDGIVASFRPFLV